MNENRTKGIALAAITVIVLGWSITSFAPLNLMANTEEEGDNGPALQWNQKLSTPCHNDEDKTTESDSHSEKAALRVEMKGDGGVKQATTVGTPAQDNEIIHNYG